MTDMERDLRSLTPQALAKYGNADLAYIKKIVIDGAPVFEVHAADGRQLASFGEREMALAATLQNELVPVSVH